MEGCPSAVEACLAQGGLAILAAAHRVVAGAGLAIVVAGLDWL
jgi:hypothetical protein